MQPRTPGKEERLRKEDKEEDGKEWRERGGVYTSALRRSSRIRKELGHAHPPSGDAALFLSGKERLRLPHASSKCQDNLQNLY